MQETNTPSTEPLVLNIRISGRWVPVLSALSVFALLPSLTASGPLQAGAPQNLAAPSPLQEAAALGSAAAETVTVSAARLTAASLLGNGSIGFPNIALNAVTPASRAPVAMGSPFVKKAGFIMPVTGPVMSLFGPRVHPVLGVAMFHTGIDLGAACATPIRAAADGTVTYAGASSSWGQRIIIEHDSALKTGYAHLSKSFAKEGDAVKQGQVIGLVGTTGWSTGCHLHFDVILHDRYVDPRPYLGLGPASPASIPYTMAPHSVRDSKGTVRTVPDGDVPIPTTSGMPTTSPTTSVPTTTTPSSTSSPTSSTTTAPPTTTEPPTTTDPTTSEPTTTTEPPTTTDPTTSEPTTTTEPTTSEPTTTTEPAAEPTTTTTTSEAPASSTSDSGGTTDTTASSTSAAEPTTTSEPAATTAEETTTTSTP